MPIKLLALDLDGTLVDRFRTISARVQAAIRAAVERGVRVSIATGREYVVTEKFARLLGLTSPVICCQGAFIYDPLTGQTIHQEGLSLPLAHLVIDLARSQRLALNFYLDGKVYTEYGTPESRAIFSKDGAPLVEVDDLKQALTTAPFKGLIVHPADEIEQAAAQLRAAVGEAVRVVRSSERLIETTLPTVSKGKGLAILADYYGIAQDEVMAIGDHDNDIEMIAWAGLGVVMGNGSSGAKAVADVIAPPISEDGAAWAIEHFILGEGDDPNPTGNLAESH
jgi:hypothetical protein